MKKLPPDEVIRYTLQALQKDQERAFFLYIDKANMLKNIDPRRAEAYRRMSELQREETLKSFEAELWQARMVDTGSGFNRKPSRYDILSTSYDKQRATVVAYLRYSSEGFTEVKEFVYILEKQQDVWKIVDYQVNNKGTE